MAFEAVGSVVAEEVFADASVALAADAFGSSTVADIAAGLSAAGVGGITAGQLAGVALNLGTNFLFGQALQLLFPAKKPGAGMAPAQTALINSVSNVDAIPVLYGSRRIGGSRILTEVTGSSGEFLQLVVVFCEGPISVIQKIYLDGVDINDAKFAGLVTAESYTGSDTQGASAALVAAIGNSAKWNANCTLSGIAYVYLQLKWDKTAFPGGLPNVTADINGRTLYDPRDASTSFNHNPALAIRDYLTNARYGRGIPSSMIDDAAFSAAASTCDEVVSSPVDGTAVRYTCDGLVDIDQQPIDNLRALLTSCRGFMVFSGGQYKLKIDKSDSAVSFTLTEDNIIGAWSFALATKRTKFNRVKGRFYDSAQSWQQNIAIQENTTYRTQDNGLVLETQLELPFTTDAYRAQQICQVELKRSRFGIAVSCVGTIACMQLEVGDVVALTHATPGWTSKLFRVIEIELLATDEVRLSLLEYDATAYSLDALVLVNTAPATNLPNPSVVASPGTPSVVESLFQTTGSAGVKSRVTISWGASPDLFVQSGGGYIVEYTPAGGSAQRAPLPSSVTSLVVDDVPAGNLTVRVFATNSIGAVSPASATTTQYIFGLSAAPSDLANFAVQSYNGQAKFTWSKPSSNSDLDVVIGGRVYVRWSPLTSGATWDHGSLVNPDGYPGDTSIGMGPLLTGTYLAKAADSSGNYSVNAASFVVTEALITGLSTLATVTESPAFSGSKSNVAAADGGIQLDSVTTIDGMLTLMDAWGSIDSLGGIQATGSYSFASKMDLGSVKSARLYTTLGSLAFDADDLIDSRTNNMDDWGLFDGAVVEDVEAQLMVRATNDDPAAAPVWGPWHALGLAADYNARGFDFRLDFASGNATHNRSVTSLAVAAKA